MERENLTQVGRALQQLGTDLIPAYSLTAFVPFAGNVRNILCIQEDRVVSNENTVRYNGLALQITADKHRNHFVKVKVRVHAYPDGELAVFHGPRCIGHYQSDGSLIKREGNKQTAA